MTDTPPPSPTHPTRVRIITREEGFVHGQQFAVVGWTEFEQPVIRTKDGYLLVLDPGDFEPAPDANPSMAPSPNDDELVEKVARSEFDAAGLPRLWVDAPPEVRKGYRIYARRILALVRRPLEARGIEMAAEEMKDEEPWIAGELCALARRHAEGGKNG